MFMNCREYRNSLMEWARGVAPAPEVVSHLGECPPCARFLDEQRALLEFAERSTTLTRDRFEELAALPEPLVGRLEGAQAAARLLGMANYIAGKS